MHAFVPFGILIFHRVPFFKIKTVPVKLVHMKTWTGKRVAVLIKISGCLSQNSIFYYLSLFTHFFLTFLKEFRLENCLYI